VSLLADDPAGRTAGALRVMPLGDAHRAALELLVAEDPLVNVVADARLRLARQVTARELGGTVLGTFDATGRLTGAVLDTGSVQPIGGGPAEWAALAGHLALRPRSCSSLVGESTAVRAYWSVLRPQWGPERAVRACQPLLVIGRDRLLPPGHPDVRAMRMADLDAYLPAAAAMFTEELGVSPIRGIGGTRGYRSRLAGLIAARRAFGIRDSDGTIVFKADFGCVTPGTVQVQGVWTRPDLRGRGIARQAMAAVLREGLDRAATVSLYVNDFNVPARRLYARLGMIECATLSTVLF